MATLSNIGHWIEGGVLLVVAAFSLAEARGSLREGWGRYFAPAFTILAGFLVGPFLALHHGIDRAAEILGDPQQSQHVIMGTLLLAGGIADVLAKRLGRPRLGMIMGAVIATIGVMFMAHTQHGTSDAVQWAVRIHQMLGAVLVVAGGLRIAWSWLQPARKRLGYVSAGFLALAALTLLAYREPEGAFEHGAGNERTVTGSPSPPPHGAH